MKKYKNKASLVLQNIPSVDEIIVKFSHLRIPPKYLKYKLNLEFDRIRQEIIEGEKFDDIHKYISDRISTLVNNISNNSLRSVINGTGIILHTGLGRAPISKDILIDGINRTYPYSNLEFNLHSGLRDDRNNHVSDLLSSLCLSEKAIVVNNNASAVMLMINSICEDKEIIISRGQLVEIGGVFRIPDVIKKSQVQMVEVGTTNKTHLKDYEDKINNKTAAILYVHTSNYKVIGFTDEVEIRNLAKLAHAHDIPLLIDLGSGAIADFASFGLPMEKVLEEYIKSGADVVSFSGDKLLGGPQAGIIVGKSDYIDLMFRNPIYRASRCDKIRISILETILRTYISSDNITDDNLSIKLFKRTQKQLSNIAKKVLDKISSKMISEYNIKYQDSEVEAGSGSIPTKKLSSVSISFHHLNISSSNIYNKFLSSNKPIIGYIKNDMFYIDLKAITNDQIDNLILSIIEVLK